MLTFFRMFFLARKLQEVTRCYRFVAHKMLKLLTNTHSLADNFCSPIWVSSQLSTKWMCFMNGKRQLEFPTSISGKCLFLVTTLTANISLKTLNIIVNTRDCLLVFNRVKISTKSSFKTSIFRKYIGRKPSADWFSNLYGRGRACTSHNKHVLSKNTIVHSSLWN